MAKEQTERAVRGSLPSLYARHYYWAIRIVAVIVVIFGWLCFAFSTVFLITLLF